MLKIRLMRVHMLLMVGALLIASCGAGSAEGTATPTLSVNQIQTAAVGTFQSAVTLTAMAAPTNTPVSPTPTVAPTQAALATSAGLTPFGAATPGVPVSGGSTASCYGLTFVRDISIPDNTQMDPGETFTKTWQVLNSGSCAWDAGFKFQNTGGNAMGASAVTLPSAVASGATFDVSVPMTAPSAAGTARGNWRMSTATGQFFGDEVFVVIVVGNAAPAATNTTGAPAPTEGTTAP
jgi:Ig-like domain from next to BRCA1 gene